MDISDLIKEAKKHHDVDADKLRSAYDFAQRAHAGQTRMSGEPYITHPLEVTMILAEYGADEESLIAALLHDVVEDTHYSLEEISKQFGKTVARMVDSLTKLPHVMPIDAGKYQQFDTKIESIRKIFEVMQDDVRVIVIKLCDRLHNMMTLSHFRTEKQRRIAQETLSIYVKIADRLCMYDLKDSLAEISYSYLFSHRYEELQSIRHSEVTNFERIKKGILEKFKAKPVLGASDIQVRQVFPYERLADSDVDQIEIQREAYIIVDKEEDCYLALRELHQIWKNIRGTFSDYVTLPKSNGYQALETSVYMGDGTIVRFIIQTKEMHEYFKKGVMVDAFSSSHASRKIRLPWVESLKKIHKETKNQSSDYMSALENDILRGSIIVYTDDNKTLFLPPESSALDAAFFYDSRRAPFLSRITIGNSFRNFSTFLHEGDKIHFEWDDKERLEYDWLSKVNTAYSKSIIYEYVHGLSPHKKTSFGYNILQDELSRRGFGYVDEIDEKDLRKLFKEFRVHHRSDLYQNIAEGIIPGSYAAELIFSSKKKENLQKSADYELEMELLPGKYGALSSLLKAFDQKGAVLKNLRFQSPSKQGLLVKSEVSLPYASYDSFVRLMRGFSDLRFVSLQDLKRVKIGSGLLIMLIVLVALDPVVAYYLLHDLSVHPFDLLTIRFLSVFIVASIVLFFRRIRTGYVEEAGISINNKYFFLSLLALFSTALFTYLALERSGTPFYYQLSIYLLFFPFMAIQLKQYSRSRIVMYSLLIVALYLLYSLYLVNNNTFDHIFSLYVGIVSLSFIVYTHASIVFQREQHIHRRYLSFFKILSFYAVLMSLIPHAFRASVEMPSLQQIGASFLFSLIFIFIPYILYFIITGIYGYTVTLWRKIVFILLIVIAGEMALLGFNFNIAELIVGTLFILGYYIYSKPYQSITASSSTE